MKKLIKKLSRENLSQIMGSGVIKICCEANCDTGECLSYAILPNRCPSPDIC